MKIKHPASVFDYRLMAKAKLPKKVFDYIDAGACDEITKNANRVAFDSISMRPLCLRDVSTIDHAVDILGNTHKAPILIAPTAFHQLVDKNAEISTALAAKAMGIPMIVSSMSNKSLEEIAKCSLDQSLWLQTYIFKNRKLTAELIQRAEKSGYQALVISVGTPVSGKRDRDIHNQFKLPSNLSTGNFTSTLNNENIYDYAAHEFDPSFTWKDIEWLKSLTSLPIILKGILNPVDAGIACELNLAGIVVSNHGGRQLDTVEASILVLPDIAKVVNRRTMILIDGSVARGTDVFKAIALGAQGVLIGRPVLWALAAQGQTGLEAMLSMIMNELEIAMKLTGCRNLSEISAFVNHLSINTKK